MAVEKGTLATKVSAGDGTMTTSRKIRVWELIKDRGTVLPKVLELVKITFYGVSK
jgi:hypothetical protein